MLASDLGARSLAGAGVRVDFADDGSYRGFEALDGGWADLVAAAAAHAEALTKLASARVPRHWLDDMLAVAGSSHGLPDVAITRSATRGRARS